MIETTRCSQSQAELALFDHDNNLEEAVNYIIENQNNTDSWTEPKKKGDKKKEDEIPVGRYRRGEANGGAGLTGRGRGGGSKNYNKLSRTFSLLFFGKKRKTTRVQNFTGNFQKR